MQCTDESLVKNTTIFLEKIWFFNFDFMPSLNVEQQTNVCVLQNRNFLLNTLVLFSSTNI